MPLLQTVYAGQRAPQVRDQNGGIVLVKIRPLLVKTVHFCLQLFAPVVLFCLWLPFLLAVGAGRRVPIVLQLGDAVPAGNQLISLPDIHSVDGAVSTAVSFPSFLAVPRSMQIPLVANPIYARVLPVIGIFAAVYVMRISRSLTA